MAALPVEEGIGRSVVDQPVAPWLCPRSKIDAVSTKQLTDSSHQSAPPLQGTDHSLLYVFMQLFLEIPCRGISSPSFSLSLSLSRRSAREKPRTNTREKPAYTRTHFDDATRQSGRSITTVSASTPFRAHSPPNCDVFANPSRNSGHSCTVPVVRICHPFTHPLCDSPQSLRLRTAE